MTSVRRPPRSARMRSSIACKTYCRMVRSRRAAADFSRLATSRGMASSRRWRSEVLRALTFNRSVRRVSLNLLRVQCPKIQTSKGKVRSSRGAMSREPTSKRAAGGRVSGEEVAHGKADIGEGERRHDVAGAVHQHTGVAVGARFAIYLDGTVHRQAEPELGDARTGIETRRDEAVEADTRIGHFDGKQNVLRGRKLSAVGDGPRP